MCRNKYGRKFRQKKQNIFEFFLIVHENGCPSIPAAIHYALVNVMVHSGEDRQTLRSLTQKIMYQTPHYGSRFDDRIVSIHQGSCPILLHISMSEFSSWALYRFTDPIRYVSSILLIDIRYVSTIFSILSSNSSIQPTEICDVERSFPWVIL